MGITRVPVFTIAQSANVSGNLLNMLGAGQTDFHFAALPVRSQRYLSMLVEVGRPSDQTEITSILVRVLGPRDSEGERRQLWATSGSIEMEPVDAGEVDVFAQQLPIVFPMNRFEIDAFGTHTVELWADSVICASLEFSVHERHPAHAGAAEAAGPAA